MMTLLSAPRPAEDLVRLAALCGHVLPSGELVRGREDAAQLAELARRHRVEGLVHRGLLAAGFTDLAEDAQAVAIEALQAGSACRELRDAFAAKAIPLLFLKGLPVARQAYGDASLKTSADVDVLIEQSTLADAARILTALGYTPVLPASPQQLSSWHRSSKESVWLRAGAPPLELHTALADNGALLSTLAPFSDPQEVEVFEGLPLLTLNRQAQFAYLAVHGASSAWFRMKWLSDFTALLPDADRISDLHHYARTVGAGRAARWALLLAALIFGVRLPPALTSELQSDKRLSVLLAIAVQQLNSSREPTERRLGTVSIHFAQLLLQPGLTFPLREAARQARSLLYRLSA